MMSLHKETLRPGSGQARFLKIAIFCLFIAVSLVWRAHEVKADTFEVNVFGITTDDANHYSWEQLSQIGCAPWIAPFSVTLKVTVKGSTVYETAPIVCQGDSLKLVFQAECLALLKEVK